MLDCLSKRNSISREVLLVCLSSPAGVSGDRHLKPKQVNIYPRARKTACFFRVGPVNQGGSRCSEAGIQGLGEENRELMLPPIPESLVMLGKAPLFELPHIPALQNTDLGTDKDK